VLGVLLFFIAPISSSEVEKIDALSVHCALFISLPLSPTHFKYFCFVSVHNFSHAPCSVCASQRCSFSSRQRCRRRRAQSRATINEHAEAGFQISVGTPDEVIELL
jgi:hypothetical protein